MACEDAEQWHSLAACVGRPELAYEGAWEAVKAAPPRGELGRLLEEIFAEDDAETWCARLAGHGVPCGPSTRAP